MRAEGVFFPHYIYCYDTFKYNHHNVDFKKNKQKNSHLDVPVNRPDVRLVQRGFCCSVNLLVGTLLSKSPR